MNNVTLTGRLTKDPEQRTTGSGATCTQFTLAVARRFQSQGQPDADFINCVAWGKTAETICRYLHKGSLIGVQGRIQTRSYENQQGQRVYVTEVIVESLDFLESKNNAQTGGMTQTHTNTAGNHKTHQNANYSGSGGYPASETMDIRNDDLPF